MITVGTSTRFEAWVENTKDGTHLNEVKVVHHPAEGNNPPHSECFIETIDDTFGIKIRKLSRGRASSKDQCKVSCWMDGNRLKEIAWLSTDVPCTLNSAYVIENGTMYRTGLKFAPLPTTDDDSMVTLKTEELQDIGTIVVELHFGTYTKTTPAERSTSSLMCGVADEKHKKFLYQIQTSDRQEVQNTKSEMYCLTPRVPSKNNYRFVFKYRPRALLTAMGLIEGSPGPELEADTPPPKKRKRKHSEIIDLVDSDNDEDVKPFIKQEQDRKRIEYLEEQLRRANKQLESRKTLDEESVVDLCSD